MRLRRGFDPPSFLLAGAGLLALALGLAGLTAPAQPGPVWIRFDSLPNGTRISDQFAEQGVRFANDYVPGRYFQASPVITTYALARSAPNVLVNTAFDDEVWSSANVPLVLHFAAPISGVGMQLGCFNNCGTVTGATVRLFDCQGTLRAEGQAMPRSDFLTPIQVLDPSGTTRSVVIDYGSSTTPEAIDDLTCQFSTASCEDTYPPSILVTSHYDGQIVASPDIHLQGRILDSSGFIALAKINGATVPVTPRLHGAALPLFEFDWPMTLQPGANAITVVAWDGDDNQDSANLTLYYGAPQTVDITKFHLTQRGIMHDTVCDVDGPLVAGKFTIIQVQLDAQTAGGAPTYVESVKMFLFRRVATVDVLVGTYDGTTYSPFVSSFDSPGQMAGVHFWLEGNQVEVPGDYKMLFQAFVGETAVGSPMPVPCANPYFTFTLTRPIKLLVLPVEAPLFSTALPERNKMALFDQLDQVARTYPVRDGVSELSDALNTGVEFAYCAPHKVCDGMATNDFCLGTGYEWTFKDAHPDGLWRALHIGVGDPALTNCMGSHTIGGAVVGTNMTNMPRTTVFGFFTPGAPPEWRAEGKYHAVPIDDNHNGVIDASDIAHYVMEIRDPDGQWTTDLSQFSPGVVFRSWQDTDGNLCFTQGESYPPTAHRWYNVGDHLLTGPAHRALEEFNQQNLAEKVDHAILWLAPDFHPWFDKKGFHMLGPGQGDKGGDTVWISPGLDTNDFVNDNVLPHELGHNFGYDHETVPIPAWRAYICYRLTNPNRTRSVMQGTTLFPDDSFLLATHYQEIFDTLKGPIAYGTTAPQAQEGDPPQPALFLSGAVNTANELLSAHVSVGEANEFTEMDRTSPWRIRISARGGTTDHLFPVHYRDAHPETLAEQVGGFQVVLPQPEGTEWVEIRYLDTALTRRVRSAHTPFVEVLYPNGGEQFGPYDPVLIEWTAADDDDDPLSFSVSYSPDGQRWLPVASGLRETTYLWRVGSLPGGPEGRIRVTASDGFNLSQDESDGIIQIAGKPPQILIREPREGTRFLEGEFIPLRAVAFDPEGQPISVTWLLDGQPVAYALTTRLNPIAPGEHWVTLSVVDSEGYEVQREAFFTVLADTDRDGMSDRFELRHELDPTLAADALQDPDGDGLNNFDEAWRGLNPRVRDTDEDGVSDGDEVEAGFDPGDAASTPPCMRPPEALVDWWPAEGNGEDIVHELYAFLEPGVEFAPGKVGTAFRFTGGGGAVVEHHPNLLPAALTVAAWIQPVSYAGNRVLEKGGYRVTGGYGLEFNPFGSLGIRFVVWNWGPVSIDSDVMVPLEAWTHVAGTFDGAVMRLYVNGVPQSQTAVTSMTGNTAPLTIGRASGGNDLFFTGLIDEVQLYARALEAEEIGAIFESGSAGLCRGCFFERPGLGVFREDSVHAVFWPRCPGWVLEWTPVLQPPPLSSTWNVIPAPYAANPMHFYFVQPVTAGNRFYRLRQE